MRLYRSAADPIRVMLLDGESGGPYHKWALTSPLLKKQLEETGLFQVEIVTAPPAGGDYTAFHPDFRKYAAVVWNYDAPDERWPAGLKQSFEQYVRDGGGVVIVHAADNAFPNWLAFNEMTGVGGWRGRTEKNGPYWYYKDGKLTPDPAPGPAGSHGQRTPYQVDGSGKPSDHRGSAQSLDAPGRRAVRAPARPGEERHRSRDSVFGSVE